MELAGTNATARLFIGGAIVRLENISHEASLLGAMAHVGSHGLISKVLDWTISIRLFDGSAGHLHVRRRLIRSLYRVYGILECRTLHMVRRPMHPMLTSPST